MAPDMASSYDASSITILEGLSAVRKRPAMYIGSTDVRGLHHLVYEVVDNSIDEAMAGFCTRITVILHADNSVTVRDDGRGIPVDIHPKEGVPAVQVVMTKLHAGGKFDNNSYKVSGGLHGVGVSCVNALSEWLTVTVRRDGKRYRQHYSRGVPQDQLTVIGEADGHGTTVRFQPDEQIFEVLEFSYDTLKKRFEELAYLNKGLYIECIDERTSETHVFHAEGGIRQFVSDLNSGQQGIHPIIMAEGVVDNVAIDFALQYNAGYKETILTFSETATLHDTFIRMCGEQGFAPRIAYKSLMTRFSLKMVAMQQCVAVLPQPILQPDLCQELAVVPLKPEIPWEIAIIRRKEGYRSYAAAQLFEHICAYFAGLDRQEEPAGISGGKAAP